MKRFLTAFLAALMAAAMLGGCAKSPEPTPTTDAPTPTQSPEEAKALKIMIIGNSHSNDTFWLLHEAFADQMPEQALTLGVMYYSGCPVSKHVKFTTENQYVYEFHRNDNGIWETMKQANMDAGLCNQAWDIVVFQGGRGDTENEYNLAGRRALEQIVSDRVPQPYKLMWQITWPSPDEPAFFAPEYPVQPPSGWVEYLQTSYGHDTFRQFTVMTDKAKEYLVGDETYEKVICSGAGVMYAHAALGVPQSALWRDYTHLTDYGRLIAAYTFYAQFTGNAVTGIGIDKIPAHLRQARFRAEGDLIVTEEMKQVIIAAANHALEDPWTVPVRSAN